MLGAGLYYIKYLAMSTFHVYPIVDSIVIVCSLELGTLGPHALFRIDSVWLIVYVVVPHGQDR